MRIDRIQVDGFGRLSGLDTGPEALEGVVVVLGPNEAGKSTLFAFLTAALYGFQPASRERNPHVPWGADEASGRIHVHLKAGGCAEVERRLRSQPSGRLTLEGRTTELRNQPLPWVEHVSRTVFRQVFAITLGDLAVLDGETWARIQDKVVGSMGAADLRPARAIADMLERQAGEIWRPNRRGNQRLRALQAEIRALRARRTAAHQRDLAVRTLVEQHERASERLREVRARRQRDRVSLDRVQSLLPVKRQLERIASLHAQGGERGRLAGLPADPPTRYAEMDAQRARLEERRRELEGELEEREATLAEYDDHARAVLQRRDEITRLVAHAAGSAPDRIRALELDGEIDDLEARLDSGAANVLEGSWRDAPPEALLRVPIELLRDRIVRARSGIQSTDAASRAGTKRVLPWVTFAGGFTLLGWGLMTATATAAALGGGVSAVGLTLWFVRARAARRVEPSGDRGGDEADLSNLLAGVPVRPERLQRPGVALVTDLENVQALVRARAERVQAREAVRERIARVDAEARSLARALDLTTADDAEAIAGTLDRDVRKAERLQQAALLAERDHRRLLADEEVLRSSLSDVESALAALAEAAAAFAHGNTAQGLEVARARLAAHRRADQLREELERGHPNLAELEEQIRAAGQTGELWAMDDDEVAGARARIEADEDEIEQLVKRAEALDRDATHLKELETVDAVDSEIASLREEESRLMRFRDRNWVLAQLLRQADRRFREEHQPDLVRRAGSYLEHLTGGRYERLVVDETGEGSLFRLVGPGLPAPVPLEPPISTGTLEQAYLSLRLAIVDHLDQGGERLPLFVDEVFVNWDRERRDKGLEVLSAVADTRQVFVFTCHRAVAQELDRRGARVLGLAC